MILALLALPAFGQELPLGDWQLRWIDGAWRCRYMGEGDLVVTPTSPAKNWSSFGCAQISTGFVQLFDQGVVLVRLEPIPPEPVPEPVQWVLPNVVGLLAGDGTNSLIDAAAGQKANINHRSKCAPVQQFTVLDMRPQAGTLIEPGDEVILVVASDFMC